MVMHETAYPVEGHHLATFYPDGELFINLQFEGRKVNPLGQRDLNQATARFLRACKTTTTRDAHSRVYQWKAPLVWLGGSHPTSRGGRMMDGECRVSNSIRGRLSKCDTWSLLNTEDRKCSRCNVGGCPTGRVTQH